MDEDFAEYVRARQAALLRYALRLCGDLASAEDLVQEALLRTGLSWNTVLRRDDPDVYVHVAITRIFLNSQRRLGREEPLSQLPDPTMERPDYEGSWDLRSALESLSPRQRAIILLRYYLDLTEDQVAVYLGIAKGTVKSTASDAIRKLAVMPRLQQQLEM